MLILSRRIGETLMIGSDITVTVVGVKGGYIRIGINAPASVPVHREELYERIRGGTAPMRENRASNLEGARKGSPVARRDFRSATASSTIYRATRKPPFEA